MLRRAAADVAVLPAPLLPLSDFRAAAAFAAFGAAEVLAMMGASSAAIGSTGGTSPVVAALCISFKPHFRLMQMTQFASNACQHRGLDCAILASDMNAD